jgi:excisionase family DNA binding protein
MTSDERDVLTPREVADRAGFSYHAILRAIRRGDLQAFEPVAGHYRISMTEYERWLRTPARAIDPGNASRRSHRRRSRPISAQPAEPGSISRLNAIEARG